MLVLVLFNAPRPRLRRWLRVLGSEGEPPSACQIVVRGAARRELIRDPNRRVFVGDLPPDLECRIFALDPETAEGARLDAFIACDAEEIVTLRLERLESLSFTVQTVHGTIPADLKATLGSQFGGQHGRGIPGVVEAGAVRFPPAALAVYETVVISGRVFIENHIETWSMTIPVPRSAAPSIS